MHLLKAINFNTTVKDLTY